MTDDALARFYVSTADAMRRGDTDTALDNLANLIATHRQLQSYLAIERAARQNAEADAIRLRSALDARDTTPAGDH